MERKKWTPKTEITDAVLKSREKRKWQLALRRYVVEQNSSASYAFYFGLNIEQFRKWMELQFTDGLNWQNFGSAWQFDHILPVTYFDFSVEDDLVLCWNFINIKVNKIELDKLSGNRIEELAVKSYFERLFKNTGYSIVSKMIDKISQIENVSLVNDPFTEDFIIMNRKDLEITATLSKPEFNSLNKGMSLHDVLLEREIIKKFG